MDTISKISQFSRKNVEDYSSLHEIVVDVDSLQQENFFQAQASEVIERFLRRKGPELLLTGLEGKATEDRLSIRSSLAGRSVSLSPSRDSTSPILTLTRTSTTSSPALTSRSLMHSSTTNKINMIYRIEMVEREMEDGKMKMDKLRKIFESARFLLQTEEENLQLELGSTKEEKKLFENFITENTDKKTGRVFHDKYLRYLENELQNRERELRKVKLRMKTHQTEYNRMKSQQQQKLELRERLHPIDLDKLCIENGEQLQLLEQKTKQLLDLKRAVGKKGQNLVSMKSKLNETSLSLKALLLESKQKEEKHDFIGNKEAKNTNDLLAAEVLNQSIKKLNSTYRSPDVQTYLKMEVTLNELKREQDVWQRRCQNQRQTIRLLEHQVKQLAPSVSVSHSRSTKRSVFSSRSADSMPRLRTKTPFPHCTPTTPM